MNIFTSQSMAIMISMLSLSMGVVLADDDRQERPDPYGGDTRDWLRLQAAGTQAAPSPRQPGDAASRTYQRYLKSFERPIPEGFFQDREGFVEE